MAKIHERFEWQDTKPKSKKPSRVSKLRSKRIKRSIVLGLLLMLALTTWWYFFIRIPNVYGQITFSSNFSTKSQLAFKGKKYDEVILSKFDRSYSTSDGINIGQAKSYPGDSPIIIRTVPNHPDMLIAYQREEMGGWRLFQEEK